MLHGNINSSGPFLVLLCFFWLEKSLNHPSLQSTHWHRHDHYYGNGECFVFRLRPRPQRFRWSTVNDMMMLGGARSLSMGSGSEPAIWLDDELSYGMTAKCDTFANPPLVTCEGPTAMPPKGTSQRGCFAFECGLRQCRVIR
mmetsp:Transcript_8763/g.21640  ORF Transcript_8763/g.21640 Transcript_8763/m.21640 type:complete len:142 (-) Transcript_8763:1048-1473(-)